jgi:hypothetical protein
VLRLKDELDTKATDKYLSFSIRLTKVSILWK